MKIKNGIDLGAAFDVLKAGLKYADSKTEDADYTKMSLAYCTLAGFVEAHISQCTEEDKKEGETHDDIPEQLFRQ